MLAVNVHSGVRAFREGPYVSQWVQPAGQSILAGCGCSVDFTRALLYRLMENLHTAHPTMIANTWVDDIAQTAVGPYDAVVEGAIEASTQLVEGLRQQGLSISPKSRFVASDMRAAKDIQAALFKRGIDVEVGHVGQDLGVDFVAGGRRRVSNQTSRMTKMRSGVASTLKLGRITKGTATRRLILTGIKPRIYGFSALGASPTTIGTIRTSIVKGLSLRKPGGCATTALLMHNF